MHVISEDEAPKGGHLTVHGRFQHLSGHPHQRAPSGLRQPQRSDSRSNARNGTSAKLALGKASRSRDRVSRVGFRSNRVPRKRQRGRPIEGLDHVACRRRGVARMR